MDKLRKQELEHKIENASPLDFVSVLQEIEQYEKEETKAVIDDLYKELSSKGKTPLFYIKNSKRKMI